MSSRTLPRSLRVTSAAIVLALAAVVVIAGVAMQTVPALIMAACVALSAGITSTVLMSEELRDFRQKFARDRVRDARLIAEREREHLDVDASFRRAVSERLRASEAEIARLRADLAAGSTQIDELEERLATEQELVAMLGVRPEIDPRIVSPAAETDADRRADGPSELRSA
ncbi:hypothetical protein [Aeromicrobium duanguangcaii]|uniref:Uncharacterized protein n=1 Tax=Aeromicrobium duanguangcaii TaxID=2968086 RepID=A0ABY5KFI1_9ACTN|nr:hypothetical protein [Aeromicrobium duanguangcaii]MCD9154704.1 hypothetical protein [Aeromicrobium duanguangcaii]MCL3838826.1 hypothetical protein [Aeromicrobium duanguangcaii]UUI67882.1 hypothetical protein NP095_11820 [Aeromicrobium duanguangcaii]